jgi:predicted hydrolase (HD superfamily)
MTRDEAWALLTRYNHEEFHLKHARTLEGVMRWYAEEMATRTSRLLRCGAFARSDFKMNPKRNCVKSQEIMRAEGLDEALIRATASHGYGIAVAIEPRHPMEKVLYATDELTGLIGAAALMRPSKSVMDLEVKSVMKKFKSPSFAAGCSREVIRRGADMLGWPLEALVEKTILAMRAVESAA